MFVCFAFLSCLAVVDQFVQEAICLDRHNPRHCHEMFTEKKDHCVRMYKMNYTLINTSVCVKSGNDASWDYGLDLSLPSAARLQLWGE